uniref:Uncharacterized protein n=1 Tax=viral metagenome TaxID=1070528 RepID=A0A6C0HST7_9ZZZZ
MEFKLSMIVSNMIKFLFCIIILLIIYFIINIENIFDDYNKKTQKILNDYGNCKISKIYIVKKPLSNKLIRMINVATLYEYQRISEKNEDFKIHHAAIIVKIKSNKLIKFLLIEKNPTINISEEFHINSQVKSLSTKKHTLNEILNITKTRIGNEKFFNWHFYDNNCQDFVKELLITLQKPNAMDNFIDDKKMLNWVYSSKFNVYFIKFCVTLSNIIEKYFNCYNLFYFIFP